MARKRNGATANGVGTVEDNAVTVAIEDVVEEPEAVEVPALRLCECGCGIPLPTRGKDGKGPRFALGHDARHKGNLLRRYDAGDAGAGAELVERGWRTEAELAERGTKARLTAEQRTERQRAKLQAKAERLRSELAEVEQELANLG